MHGSFKESFEWRACKFERVRPVAQSDQVHLWLKFLQQMLLCWSGGLLLKAIVMLLPWDLCAAGEGIVHLMAVSRMTEKAQDRHEHR